MRYPQLELLELCDQPEVDLAGVRQLLLQGTAVDVADSVGFRRPLAGMCQQTKRHRRG